MQAPQYLIPLWKMFTNKPVYHVVGDGKTNSSYDWIYKVRDKYETYIDTATMQPLKFIRNVDEGGYKKYENVTFNQYSEYSRYQQMGFLKYLIVYRMF